MMDATQSRKDVTGRFDAKAKLMKHQMQDLEKRLRLFEKVSSNCEKTRTMSDEELRKDLNNANLMERVRRSFEMFEGRYGYGDSWGGGFNLFYNDLARLGDPLGMKIWEVMKEGLFKSYSHRGDLTKDVGCKEGIIQRIIDRSMTEKDYMDYLNGERPIGFIDITGTGIVSGRSPACSYPDVTRFVSSRPQGCGYQRAKAVFFKP